MGNNWDEFLSSVANGRAKWRITTICCIISIKNSLPEILFRRRISACTASCILRNLPIRVCRVPSPDSPRRRRHGRRVRHKSWHWIAAKPKTKKLWRNNHKIFIFKISSRWNQTRYTIRGGSHRSYMTAVGPFPVVMTRYFPKRKRDASWNRCDKFFPSVPFTVTLLFPPPVPSL